MTPFALAPILSAVLGALAGGLGVTIAFSLVILGIARSGDMRRVGRSGAATAYGTLAVLSATASVSIVALGLILVTSK